MSILFKIEYWKPQPSCNPLKPLNGMVGEGVNGGGKTLVVLLGVEEDAKYVIFLPARFHLMLLPNWKVFHKYAGTWSASDDSSVAETLEVNNWRIEMLENE